MSKKKKYSEKQTRAAWVKMCEEISFYCRNIHQARKIVEIVGDFLKEYATPDYQIEKWKEGGNNEKSSKE